MSLSAWFGAVLLALQPSAEAPAVPGAEPRAGGPSVETVFVAESECYAMVARGGVVETIRIPELRIIERTAAAGPFAVPDLPDGTGAFMCPRSSIVPAPNDWKVLQAGYPLYIVDSRSAGESSRVGVLEASQGQVRYRLVSGDFANGEEAAVRARLNQLQEAPARGGED